MYDINCSTVIIPIFDTQETIDSLREQSQQTLEGQFQEIMQDLEMFAQKENTRKSTMAKRIQDFKDLKGKIELHSEILGFKQEALLNKLEAAQAALVESIEGEEE